MRLSTTFSVSAGDTFASIARRVYGDDKQSSAIARANPGAVEPLSAGTSLTIPDLPGAPKNLSQQIDAVSPNEVALLIDGNRFRFWTDIRIFQAIDGPSVVNFRAPFDEDNPDMREAFRPFTFAAVQTTVGDIPLFSGVMVKPTPRLLKDKRVVDVSCYALSGVLNDCTPPAAAFPLEFNDQGLIQIAASLTKPFGLKPVFLSEQGAIFERVACEPGKRIMSFLADLAKQRNLVIGSNAAGQPVFQRSAAAGSPVAILEQGAVPLLSVEPEFDPQQYYSHVTGLEPAIVGLAGSQFTVKNPRLLDVLRPHTFKVPDTLDADVKTAVETKYGRMFANMVSYSIELATWRDPQGELWAPNTTLKLLAPSAMIYTSYEFVIRSVELIRSKKSETAVLNLIIPGSLEGGVPEVLPWDE